MVQSIIAKEKAEDEAEFQEKVSVLSSCDTKRISEIIWLNFKEAMKISDSMNKNWSGN